MDTTSDIDSLPENTKKEETANDRSTTKKEGSEDTRPKLKYVGMTSGRRRSMERGRKRRRSSFGRLNRLSSFSSATYNNRNGSNSVGKELTALVMLSLLTILAFVSLIDLDPAYIISWLEWLQEDDVRGVLVLLAALMLAIPFFLPITKIVYVTLGFFYGFLAGWVLSMVGVTLGFLLTFFIGRFLCTCIHDYIDYRAETLLGRRKWIIIQKLLLRDGIYCTFALRFMPLPSNLLCYILATTCVRNIHFVIGTLLKAPISSIPIYVAFGSHMRGQLTISEVLQASDNSFWINIIFTICFLFIFGILFYMLRKRVQADFNRRMSHFEAPPTLSTARGQDDTSGRQEQKPDNMSTDDVLTEVPDDLENSLTTV